MSESVSLSDRKRAMRAAMRQQLRALPEERRQELSRAACDAVVNAPWFAAARTVFAFVSLPGELDTMPLLGAVLAAGKRLALPRTDVKENAIVPTLVGDLGDLIPGAYGVREPRAGEVVTHFGPADVALVPGLAFDPRGGRLGRGGGYFDRFLARHGSLLTCGLAFDLQLIAAVPMEPFDKPVAWLATESGVRPCG
ncbi:MAG TPA: 5-formyltetrahydrofolate cyclo-ligase [Planctomycetota bacterium]|nr:5-formyltetrahydrofolate cyclo-ligase [Planctomycetota bacterium]